MTEKRPGDIPEPRDDAYLWSREGPPDPDVARLEDLLRSFRGSDRRWQPAADDQRAAAPPARAALAAAAVLLLALGAAILAPRPHGAWNVARLEGTPRIAERPLQDAGRMREGDWLVTDTSSRARVEVGGIGVLDVGPSSRVRLASARASLAAVELVEGTLLASIVAPPGRFVVHTPWARAVDLGCVYALTVEPSGAGRLRVLAGWVAFDHGGVESFVPEDAECLMRPGHGPGTPHMRDAAPELVDALARVDFGPGDARGADIRTVLDRAGRDDALTLWHLLSRVAPGERGPVFDRLAELVPPPAGVGRDAVVGGDGEARDRWWASLGHGDVTWWRAWKQPSPGRHHS